MGLGISGIKSALNLRMSPAR